MAEINLFSELDFVSNRRRTKFGKYCLWRVFFFFWPSIAGRTTWMFKWKCRDIPLVKRPVCVGETLSKLLDSSEKISVPPSFHSYPVHSCPPHVFFKTFTTITSLLPLLPLSPSLWQTKLRWAGKAAEGSLQWTQQHLAPALQDFKRAGQHKRQPSGSRDAVMFEWLLASRRFCFFFFFPFPSSFPCPLFSAIVWLGHPWLLSLSFQSIRCPTTHRC